MARPYRLFTEICPEFGARMRTYISPNVSSSCIRLFQCPRSFNMLRKTASGSHNCSSNPDRRIDEESRHLSESAQCRSAHRVPALRSRGQPEQSNRMSSVRAGLPDAHPRPRRSRCRSGPRPPGCMAVSYGKSVCGSDSAHLSTAEGVRSASSSRKRF